ncbi:MAG TPA: MerC domain-containing protein [Xanthomonadaceae bacterium]|nr:MerC domain-containing protein [Xanthomonadaceae bacterium]
MDVDQHRRGAIGRRSRGADRLGAALSLLCAVHCAALPLAIALVPALGLSALAGPGFERGFVVFASALALVTLWLAWRRHRALSALKWLVPGVALVVVGAFGPIAHPSLLHAAMMSAGGTLIAVAHLHNLRLSRRHADAACCES